MDDPDEVMRGFHEVMAAQREKMLRIIVNSMIDVIVMRFVPDDKADAARLHLRDSFNEVYEMGKREAQV